jgi:tellurite resistance protein TerC
MYFLLAGVVHRFVYLKYGLAAVLVFVGAKMMLVDVYKVPITISLGVIGTLIAASIIASLRVRPNDSANLAPAAESEPVAQGRTGREEIHLSDVA